MLSAVPLSSSTLTQVETILPRTVREKHCGFEDAVRYFGLGISSFGALWCYYSQMNTPAILFTLTDLTIVIVHISEKTCGTWARAARAGEKILQNYNTFLTKADQASHELKEAEGKEEQIEVTLQGETGLLLDASERIEQGTSEAQSNIETLTAEYEALRVSNAELQRTIATQQQLIQSMKEELEKSSAQNNLYQQEAEGLTRIVSSLKHTDEKFAEDAAAATTQFHEGVDNFGAKIQELQGIGQQVKEMHAQNLLLHQEIEELQKTKEELQKTLSSIISAQTTSHQNSAELSALASQLAASQADIAVTEGHIRKELAAWNQMLHPKEAPS